MSSLLPAAGTLARSGSAPSRPCHGNSDDGVHDGGWKAVGAHVDDEIMTLLEIPPLDGDGSSNRGHHPIGFEMVNWVVALGTICSISPEISTPERQSPIL